MDHAPERSRREEVLAALRRSGAPLGVAEVAARLGIHPNTARFHLDALAAEETIERATAPATGPGRPRTVYTPRPGLDRGGTREYRLLAQILLSRMASGETDAGETDAGEAARDAGRAWGGFLVDGPPPFRRLSGEEAAARLAGLLRDLGFAPEPERGSAVPDVIRLRHCPFLELAEEYGPLVCGIHLGLMQGALAELGAPATVTRLDAFAEPGACLARLERTDAA